MRKTSSFLVFALLITLSAGALASPGAGVATLAASQGTDLWGGPGAKGAGNQSAHFDTIVYVTGPSPATGAVDFWVGGSIVATSPFSVPANGVVAITAPDALAEKGAFGYHVNADSSVTAWSETYNETTAGRFGVSISAVAPSELLVPGDEASGGGADVSDATDPGRARTNVGIVCASTATQACRLEVAAFVAGTLLGTGNVETIPGSAAQSALKVLVPAAAGKSGVALRLRLLSGNGMPYAIRNDNGTSDGTAIPLSVKRGAFSTAPTIVSFTASPTSGCAPLETTFTWETSGAAKVSISGVGSDFPPSGSTKANVLASGEFVLTATALSGATASAARQVTITSTTPSPTPAPASMMVQTGGVVTGILPAGTGPVTVAFTRQDSTGSTFTVQGTSWIYTAGSTPGVDVVTLTATGSCGAASATFTASVSVPGAPRIISFASIPEATCAPTANILLTWQTENTSQVYISGYLDPFVANGGFEVTVTATTTFTLTAVGTDGTTVTQSIDVVMDPRLYVPTISPSTVEVLAGASVVITVDPATVPSLSGVRVTGVQSQSGGRMEADPSGVPGQYVYHAGRYTGTDIFRFLWVNGCGIGYSDFVAQVTGASKL